MLMEGYVSYEEAEEDAMRAEKDQLEWVLCRLDYLIQKPRLEEIYDLRDSVIGEIQAIKEQGKDYGYDL